MPESENKPRPDPGIFVGILGVLLAVFIPILQMNGLEINWGWSTVAYGVIIVGCLWTFLSHATPHCGKVVKLGGSIMIIGFGGWLSWLGIHSQYLKQHPEVPLLTITATTLPGLPESVTNDPHLRFHTIRIVNSSDTEVKNLRARLQMPEPIATNFEKTASPGMAIEWAPILTKFTVNGIGNRKFLGPKSVLHAEWPPPFLIPYDDAAQLTRYSDGDEATGIWALLIDKIPPHSETKLSFLTTDEGDATNYISLTKYEFTTNGATIWATARGTTNGSILLHDLTVAFIVQTNKILDPKYDWHLGTNELRFSLDGWYDYSAEGKLHSAQFLVPFIFDSTNRAISSLPLQIGTGKWRLVRIEYQ